MTKLVYQDVESKGSPEYPESLSKKVVSGGFWVISLRVINRGLGFIRTIILARFLSPEDFGTFGVAMLGLSTLEAFSQTGFQEALIQKKENIESYLDTAWTVSVLRGIALFLILFLSAPFISSFFNAAKATLVIKVMAITALLLGFQNVGVVLFRKQLEFNKQFVYEFSGTSVDLILAISLALILKNFWALVWGNLAANFVRLIISYIIHPYKPRMRLEIDKFRDLFNFGKWVMASGIIVFLITQGDNIFVGKMIGITALGLYQMAYLISNLPATEISQLVAQITFPAFSKLQNSMDRLRDAYLDVLQLSAFLVFPVAGGIVALGTEFTEICLGGSWVPIVSAMKVLAFAGLIRSISATTGPLFQGAGRPEIVTKWQPVRLIVLIVLIYPLTLKWWLLGTSLAVVLSNLVSAIGFSFKAIKLIKCQSWMFIARLLYPLVNTLIAVSVIYIIKMNVGRIGMIGLFVFACIYMMLYFAATCVFENYLSDRTTLLIIKEKYYSYIENDP